MTQEEKAKRYDEAIEYAHYLINERCKEGTDSSFHRADLQKMFPELKECEDKMMIQYFKDLAPFDKAEELYEKYGFSHKDAIAWLEKQGEQKTIEYPLCKTVKDKIDYYIFNHFTTDTVVKTDVNSIVKAMEEGVMIGMSEQKLDIRYVYPKFRVGDIIVEKEQNGSCLPVVVKYIGEGHYSCSSLDDTRYLAFPIELEDEYKLVEQKPADKVEPKFNVGDKIISTISNIPYYVTEVRNGYYLTDVGCVIMFNAQDNFELSNQNPVWSEEDESRIDNLCHFLEEYGNQYYGCLTLQGTIAWLKSLRHQSQWKPSERQKEALLWCVVHLGGADKQTLGELLEELNKL